ncbi:hypothetical protein LCGC14_2220700 [marine sediment metagenome]|uniref:Uncharacterized protein n=1 Tax=marine sediment metagenome TaxID=412755 RepID=A0A0F9DB66_9ZZZZ
MLDIFIWLGILLGIFFLLLGKHWMHEWPFYVSAGIFLIVGSGILLTGWETQENSPIIIQDINSTAQQVTFTVQSFDATIEDNPILVLLGTVFVGFGLVFVFMGMEESGRNRAIREEK